MSGENSSSSGSWSFADSLTTNTGSVNSGTIGDTKHDDGNYLVLNEIKNSTPGFDYEIWWESAPAATNYSLQVIGYYHGLPSHHVDIYVWDFTAGNWEATALGTMLDNTTDQTYNWSFSATDHVNSGQIRIRFLHPDKGGNGHFIYLDRLYMTSS